jgi:hypothetical protein
VVLLVEDLEGDDAQGVMATLAANYLVYAASPSVDDQSMWLQNFMEALGVTGAHVLSYTPIDRAM